jgi:hypothetical protein
MPQVTKIAKQTYDSTKPTYKGMTEAMHRACADQNYDKCIERLKSK